MTPTRRPGRVRSRELCVLLGVCTAVGLTVGTQLVGYATETLTPAPDPHAETYAPMQWVEGPTTRCPDGMAALDYEGQTFTVGADRVRPEWGTYEPWRCLGWRR